MSVRISKHCWRIFYHKKLENNPAESLQGMPEEKLENA